MRDILERARELGTNLLDAAECYGDHVSDAARRSTCSAQNAASEVGARPAPTYTADVTVHGRRRTYRFTSTHASAMSGDRPELRSSSSNTVSSTST